MTIALNFENTRGRLTDFWIVMFLSVYTPLRPCCEFVGQDLVHSKCGDVCLPSCGEHGKLHPHSKHGMEKIRLWQGYSV